MHRQRHFRRAGGEGQQQRLHDAAEDLERSVAHRLQHDAEDHDLDGEADIHQPDQFREAEHGSKALGGEQKRHDREDRERRQRDDPPRQAEHRRHNPFEEIDYRPGRRPDTGQRHPEQN